MGPGGSWDEMAPADADADDGPADVRRAVRELVRTRPEVSEDHERLDGYLRDYCPNRPAEVAVIVVAARAGVPGELAGASQGHALEAMCARLTTRLHTEAGVDSALARWAVDTWGLALGVVDPDAPAREVEAPHDAPPDDVLRAMAAPVEAPGPTQGRPDKEPVAPARPAIVVEEATGGAPPEQTPRTLRRPAGRPSAVSPPVTPAARGVPRNRLIVAGGTVAAAVLLVLAVAILPGGTESRKTETVGPSVTSPAPTEVTSAPATTEPATAPTSAPATTSRAPGTTRAPAPVPQTRPIPPAPTSPPTPVARTTAPPASPPPNTGTAVTTVPVPQAGQLVIAPQAGPPGTTIKLFAGACSRPGNWTGGEIYFGVNNPSAAGTAGEDPVTGRRWWVSSTAGWQDQLVVPAGLAPGHYTVWANCYASDPGTNSWTMFYLYPILDFTVT